MDAIFLWHKLLIGFSIVFLLAGINIVRPIERTLIEILGKYKKTVEQGFH